MQGRSRDVLSLNVRAYKIKGEEGRDGVKGTKLKHGA